MSNTFVRPHPQIAAANQRETLYAHLLATLPRLQQLPGVIGITLNGGLSRGFGDHLSEIDVTLYLTTATYSTWQKQQSLLATGITVLNGQLYDIKLVDFAAEVEQPWSDDACWDASYAEILYDPDQKIEALYAQKLAKPPSPEQAGGLMMSCWWHFRLAGDIWIHRGDPLQGHHTFNQAVIPLVKALFIANQEWIPHDKWLLHMSRTLAWQPQQWPQRLQQALSTGDFQLDSLRQRQQVIGELWVELDQYLIDHYWPGLPVHTMQRSFYFLLECLARNGVMSRAAWEAANGGSLFNVDPFHKLVTVDAETVRLDQERLLTLDPTALYEWHYAVAAAIRTTDTTT